MSKFMLAHRGDLGVLEQTDKVGERKLDGTRCHIIKTPFHLDMWSRNSEDNTYRRNYAEIGNLPEVEHDVKSLKCRSVWLDVENVWFNKDGRSIMRGSQVRCGTTKASSVRAKMDLFPINACAFDMLELNGEELTDYPYVLRKTMLEAFLSEQHDLRSLQYVPYTTEKRELWTDMLNRGCEGIMAKALMGKYEFRRSRSWLKLKNEKTAIRRVVGYTLGEGERAPYFGSLVLMNDDGSYGGNVGGGFDTDELEWWTQQLTTAQKTDKPFPSSEVGENYIPVQIAEKVKVRYFEETVNNHLRFPVYLDVVH